MKGILKSVSAATALTFALSCSALAQGSWTMIPPMPTARWVVSAAAGGDDKIYVLGGSPVRYDAFSINVVEAYEPTMKVWTRRADIPTARTPATATGHDGKIYAFGGWTGDTCFTDLVDVYDPNTGSWTRGRRCRLPAGDWLPLLPRTERSTPLAVRKAAWTAGSLSTSWRSTTQRAIAGRQLRRC